MNRQNLFLFAVIAGALYVAAFTENSEGGQTVSIYEQGAQQNSTPAFEGNGEDYAATKSQADSYLSGVSGTWVTVTQVTDGEGSIPIG